MKRPLAITSLVAASALLGGCATYYPAGGLYTEGKMGVQASGGATDKEGRACMNSVLGAVAWGDASVDAAKQDGNIQTVSTIDYEVENILGIYGKYCLVVRGK
ncbi:hypothetical protein H0Z60_11020 [Ectothiorhodospiraceae bacterium WFHF3C12]|nr:hypothetical protein [Ectothiorhodospiraceae bacterium WFHF3C12]